MTPQPQTSDGKSIVVLPVAPGGSLSALAAILLQIAKRTIQEDHDAVQYDRRKEAA